MACTFSDAELRFTNTGVRIRVYDIQYRETSGQYKFAQVRVHREAGEFVDSLLSAVEPVEVWMDGKRLFRMAADAESVSLGPNTSKRATIGLRDPRVVLERGTIDLLIEEITLREVVELYILPTIRTVDTEGVIQGVKYTDSEVDDTMTVAYDSWAKKIARRVLPRQSEFALPEWWELLATPTATKEIKEAQVNAAEEIFRWSLGAAEWALGLRNRKGGFDVEGATPAEAIQAVADTFEIETWVDDDGYLWFGHSQFSAQPIIVGEQGGDLVMSDYSVITEKSPVTQVKVEGRYRIFEIPFTGIGSDYFRVRSHSVWNGKGNGKSLFLSPKNVKSIGEVEMIAQSALLQRLIRSKQGTIAINGTQTAPWSDLTAHDVSLGDHIYVIPNESECGPDVPAGVFAVQGLTHEINPTVGWSLRINVGKLVDPSLIETTSLITSPEIDGWVDAEEFYEATNGRYAGE
ncbi:hypothetical protein [Halobellus limi]|uniref:Phage tail protein n=1 Tax=Halobellus limi TaxID=699433 RepID=A0A1H5ZIA2_9EURY|nr:hypothetical protein [Halobellus limi]QCC48080.1 hypothetical protein DV707_10650 [Halobellus limi]SEG36179.1 hypothetical protein SAMN04488133_2016 [Halobellus limi]